MAARSPAVGVLVAIETTRGIEAGNKEGDLTLAIGTTTEEMTDTGIGIGTENDDNRPLALALEIRDVAIIKISKSVDLVTGNEGRGLHPLVQRGAAAWTADES